MDFRLLSQSSKLSQSLRGLLARTTQPAAGAEDAPEGAAPVLGDTLKPLAFSPDLGRCFTELAQAAWTRPDAAGSSGLLDAVLACEAAGRLPLERSPRSIFLLAWLARQLSAGTMLDGILLDTALALDADATQNVRPQVFHDNGKWSLTGTYAVVEGGMDATHLLVSSSVPLTVRGVFLVHLNTSAVARKPVRYLDAARPAASIQLDHAPVTCLDRNAHEVLNEVASIGRLLTAAELLGASSEIMDRAIDYVGQRQQFGKPLISFQVVAHACAELYRDVELMRSLIYAVASGHLDNGAPTQEGAAQAKLLASELAGTVADKGIHLFGAEGLRWHRGLHFLARRINALQVLFGDRTACEELLVSIWEDRSVEGARGRASQTDAHYGVSSAAHG
ncbi:MAG: acyl-CoA dehydrogenase family protein [Pseudomonadota bacterium]